MAAEKRTVQTGPLPTKGNDEKSDLEVVAEKLQGRYNDLSKAFANEQNIPNRYDLKIRIEELTFIFNLLLQK